MKTSVKPFAAVLAIVALVFGLALAFRSHGEQAPDAGAGRGRARLHDLPRAARRVELAARPADEGVHPREARGGWTEKQIDDHFVAELGPQVLATPADDGFDLLAWLLPFAAIVFGAAAVGVGARAWLSEPGRATRAESAAATPSRAARSPSLELRVDQELAASTVHARAECSRSSRSRSSPGCISVVTPCVLPLVPGYLSAVSAIEVDHLGERGAGRRVVMASIPFIAGLHRRLRPARRGRGGGREHRRQDDPDRDRRLRPRRARPRLRRPPALAGAGGGARACAARARRTGSAVLLGGAFAVVAAPCIGTVLASILVLAGSSGGIARGVVLLLAYSLGLGAAFVLAGVAFAHAMRAFRWVRSHYQALRIVSGVDPDRARAAALLRPGLVAADRARPALRRSASARS